MLEGHHGVEAAARAQRQIRPRPVDERISIVAARGSDDRTVWLTASAFESSAACQFEDHSCHVWPLHELCQYGGDVVAHIAVAGGAAIGETEDKEREGSEAGGDKDAVRRAWAESDSRRVGVRKVSRNLSDAKGWGGSSTPPRRIASIVSGGLPSLGKK